MSDKKPNIVDIVEAAGEEGEITTTAKEVNDAEMIKALREQVQEFEFRVESLEYRISAMGDVSRMNVASQILPHFLGECGGTDTAIELAWGVAEDFVCDFEEKMEKKAVAMIGLLKKQQEMNEAPAITDDGETVQ